MSAAQIAHFLKVVGKGQEAAGVVAVYRAGILVGAGEVIAGGIAAYAMYHIGKWGYEKLKDHRHDNKHIAVVGEVV